MTRGNTVLVDRLTGQMQCKACGKEWYGNLASGGNYYRGAWQCPNGCNKGKSK